MSRIRNHGSARLILVVFLAVGLGILWGQTVGAQGEPATISGVVVSVKLGPWIPFANRTATLVIRDAKGTHHTVFAGRKTVYFPHRTPALGDQVSANCVPHQGAWAATSVTYQ
jgi:hypothetical protein